MLRDDVQLISVDDHLVEHPEVWQSRLPERMRESGPRVVEVDGRQEWLYEGAFASPSGLNAVAGTKPETRDASPMRFEDMRPGCYDPVARLEDMDIDGVWRSVCFPSVPGFAGRRFADSKDKELALNCVRAYNDFVLDEWCAAAPDRYIPMTILPLWDIELAAAELDRCIERGTKAIAFTDLPHAAGLPSFHSGRWDPVLARAEEAGLPFCCHFGSSGTRGAYAEDAPFAALTAPNQISLINSMASLIFSTTFSRFPGLKFVYSEGSIGWLPYAAQRFDQVWEDYRFYPMERGKFDPDTKPSELMRRHFFGCFIQDPIGIRLRDLIGLENILWEADYPHGDCYWPHSRKHITEQLADVPDHEARQIVQTNAQRIFNI